MSKTKKKKLLLQINGLKDRIINLKDEIDTKDSQIVELKERLKKLGETTETINIAKSRAYGVYQVIAEDVPVELGDYYLKERMAEMIARVLIEQNVIQFISVKDPSVFGKRMGAKLFVVNWEDMQERFNEIKIVR